MQSWEPTYFSTNQRSNSRGATVHFEPMHTAVKVTRHTSPGTIIGSAFAQKDSGHAVPVRGQTKRAGQLW